MIAFLRRWFCSHANTLRHRDPSGRYWLVCVCGYRSEVPTASFADILLAGRRAKGGGQ